MEKYNLTTRRTAPIVICLVMAVIVIAASLIEFRQVKRRAVMDYPILKIKMSQYLYCAINDHTVHKTMRAPRKKSVGAICRKDKPPPAQFPAPGRLLNDTLMAVDFANFRKIYCLFLFLIHFIGCRDLPINLNFPHFRLIGGIHRERYGKVFYQRK